MLKAAYHNKVRKYLLTSTVGVYSPEGSYLERDVWKGDPHPGDKYSAWAKRVAELAAEAYMKEYKWGGIVIVRPGNTYGPWDNFDIETGMVTGALINKFCSGEEIVSLQGNGLSIRDFTYSADIADGMILALEKGGDCQSFNLGIGKGWSVMDLVNYLLEELQERNLPIPKVEFEDSSMDMNKRILKTDLAKDCLGFRPQIEFKRGVQMTVDWYLKYKEFSNIRYNAFK